MGVEAGVGEDVGKRFVSGEIAARAVASDTFHGVRRNHELHAGLRSVGIERRFQRTAGDVEVFGVGGPA